MLASAVPRFVEFASFSRGRRDSYRATGAPRRSLRGYEFEEGAEDRWYRLLEREEGRTVTNSDIIFDANDTLRVKKLSKLPTIAGIGELA